jgi:hypothetical protein
MAPYDSISEAISAKTDYNETKKTLWVYLNGKYVGLSAGRTVMTAGSFGEDERFVSLDIAPLDIGGKLYVPLRAMAEGLGMSVGWNSKSGTVDVIGETAGEPIDSLDKLIAAVSLDMAQNNTEFAYDTVGLLDAEVGLNICDYFLSVYKSDSKWWTYNASGNRNSYVRYRITYFMYVNIGQALKTGDFTKLTEDEIAVNNEARKVIAAIIKPDMNDYEKEKAVHDYLVVNTQYDLSQNVPEVSHTPYGALINKTAVCNGYSDSFKIFMDMLGIPCDVVYGMAKLPSGEAQAHSWNRVRLDGDYYLVDVTWDDPTPDRGQLVSYQYLNVTDEQMSKDRKPSVVSVTKRSVATKYNYYVYERTNRATG